MYRRGKRDGNHAEIVQALQAAGRAVLELHAVGGGCPDLLVSWGGHTILMEVKNPAGRGRKLKLLPSQVAFWQRWKGRIVRVDTVLQALAATGVGSAPPAGDNRVHP